MPPDHQLTREAIHLHRCLFRAEIPPEVIRQYIEAHQYIVPENVLVQGRSPAQTLATIFDRGLDIEAIELVLRRAKKRNFLTQKMQILCYLTETDHRYYRVYHNESVSMAKAYLRLSGACVKTVLQWVRGHYLLWRLRRV